MVTEAHIEGDKIEFNGWFRISLGLVAVIFSLILSWSTGTLVYTYNKVLPELTSNIIANDKDARSRDLDLQKQINQNRVLIAEVTAMRGDVERIKNLMERYIQK